MRLPTVLIADDDPQIVLALRMRLRAAGFEVIECRDGLSVLAKSRLLNPDVLILDHEMPLGDGRSLARNIRAHTQAPIVFLSGHDRESFRDTVRELPNTYFLGKPIEFEKLGGLLESLIPTESCVP